MAELAASLVPARRLALAGKDADIVALHSGLDRLSGAAMGWRWCARGQVRPARVAPRHAVC
jgi:hypothetical protein